MLYATYGYINLAKNIYNLEAFCKNNDKVIKNINAINGFGHEINFEYTTDRRVVLGFEFTNDILEAVKAMYKTFIQELKTYFPDLEVIIKVETIVDGKCNSWFGFDKRVLDCINEA